MEPRHILVLVEPGRRGGLALARAAAHPPEAITVVALAPQADGPRCGTSILDYNRAVLDAVHEELARARAALAPTGARVTCRCLAATDDAALSRFIAAESFDLVLLPPRRRGGHPEAARVRALGAAPVQVAAT